MFEGLKHLRSEGRARSLAKHSLPSSSILILIVILCPYDCLFEVVLDLMLFDVCLKLF